MSYTVSFVNAVPGGLEPRLYYLQLTWTDSTDPNAVSVNVYRATVSGGPYSLIANVADGLQLYNDFSVVFGTRYFYVLKELDNTSTESAASAEVSAVPGPH